MNAANRQYTRWLTLLGTIITHFAAAVTTIIFLAIALLLPAFVA